MGKLHLIMPMGGEGSRFYKNGYMLPKPLIELNGRPFLYWATNSVLKYINVEDLCFVVLKKHVEEFGIISQIKKFYPEATIKVIPDVLPGPVLTCMEGCKEIRDDLPILFNDCDHMFGCASFYNSINRGDDLPDGALLTFQSTEPQFSYVKYDNEKIIGTIEKKAVSTHAICGAYGFRNADIFRKASEIYLKDCQYSEYFVSGIYNVLCSNGQEVKDYLLDFHVEFGTPAEYEKAKGSEWFQILKEV